MPTHTVDGAATGRQVGAAHIERRSQPSSAGACRVRASGGRVEPLMGELSRPHSGKRLASAAALSGADDPHTPCHDEALQTSLA